MVDYDAAVDAIMDAAILGKSFTVSALAVHGVMCGALDPEHRYRLNHLDLVTPDGQPVRWALSLLHGEDLPERVYGPELTWHVYRKAAALGIPVYLFGSRLAVLEKLLETLQREFPALKVAGMEPGKYRRLSLDEAAALDHRIKSSGAGIVMVGLGCPRQEIFIYEQGRKLNMPLLAVGAAFDFHAGTVKQAPLWMQKRGLEWLFRLSAEPRRLWRRYLLLNPLYCTMLVLQRLGFLRALVGADREPQEELRIG